MENHGGALNALKSFASSWDGVTVLITAIAITIHLIVRLGFGVSGFAADLPLMVVVALGGIPLTIQVMQEAVRSRGGADTLAAVSIITAVLLDEWLVAAIIVLMLSGGEALEEAATKRATGTLDALARRAPTLAHRVQGGSTTDIPVEEVAVGDAVLVLPHELCPVDGDVIAGHGRMDESYLTGEPYLASKSVGSAVLSGAVNGDTALTVRALALAKDSRYATIAGVLREAEENRPAMRRLADHLGAWYTVIAITMGVLGWVISGEPTRFLAVVVIATPCPLLIGVPVAIIGAISLAAHRGIIVKNPSVLEQTSKVTAVMFDKTGTLTYGRPVVTSIDVVPGVERDQLLRAAAAIEHYSRHPLAAAIIDSADGLELPTASDVSEHPGEGLRGTIDGHSVWLTNRATVMMKDPDATALLPDEDAGLETAVLIDGRYAGLIQMRDEPRESAANFISHLPGSHDVERLLLVTGDRESEARYLAEKVGIGDVHAGMSPEAKLAIVEKHNARGGTLFIGDGINDAPAMATATVGVSMGTGSDITSEAADVVILDSSLERLDELLHIGARMRRIALQSAVGGMALSMIGMVLAVFGVLTPLIGAIAQEVIDILAIANAARVAVVRAPLTDYE